MNREYQKLKRMIQRVLKEHTQAEIIWYKAAKIKRLRMS